MASTHKPLPRYCADPTKVSANALDNNANTLDQIP